MMKAILGILNRPLGNRSPARLPRAEGNIDLFQLTEREMAIEGWLLDSKAPLHKVVARCHGILLGESAPSERPDVAAAYPAISHAGLSGFNIRGPRARARDGLYRISLEGWRRGKPVAELRWNTWANAEPGDPPPARLLQRISGSTCAESFDRLGLMMAIDFFDAIQAHREAKGVETLLDWGCGCGRIVRHLPKLLPSASISGCDIDGEAVDWCSQHYRTATFRKTELYPPTPFGDGAFDVVLGCSVMTHLSEADQLRWLDEIRRITKPGGLFIPSVHGLHATSRFPEVRAILEEKGVYDALDPTLDGVAPPGYYRSIFQTASYTRLLWGGRFKILDHISGGLAGYQDLVIMQRPE